MGRARGPDLKIGVKGVIRGVRWPGGEVGRTGEGKTVLNLGAQKKNSGCQGVQKWTNPSPGKKEHGDLLIN